MSKAETWVILTLVVIFNISYIVMTEASIKKTKQLWYIKNRTRLLAKAREYYNKTKKEKKVEIKPKKITLYFD